MKTQLMKRLAAVLLVVPAFLGCHHEERATLPTEDGPVVLGVKAVSPRSGEEVLSRVTGELRARREATLSAELSGRIATLTVDVGSKVKRGQVLVQLDTAPGLIQLDQAKAARAMAQANVEAARSELRRTEALARGDAAPAAALERAHTAVTQATAGQQQASAAVAAAEDFLRRTAVIAPFDGVITARLKSVGEMVSVMPPSPVLTMVDLSSLEVRAAVPETVIGLLKPGSELACTVSPSGTPFFAKVRVVGSVVDPMSRTVDVRADPSGSDLAALRPGSLVQVDVGGASSSASGLFLPAEVVRTEGEQSFVWLIDGEQVHRRSVQVEKVGPGTMQVVSGLSSSDRVVAQAEAGLADGTRVRVSQ